MDLSGLRRPSLTWLLLAGGLTAATTVAAACRPAASSAERRGGSADILLPIDSTTIEARVPRNATLELILRQHELPAELTTALVDAVREVFNPRRLRVDQPYRITRSLDGIFREFRYDIDADHFLRVAFRDAAAAAAAPAFDAEVVSYPKEIVTDAVEATITRERPSIIAALTAEGENQLLALQIAQIFGGEVDFNSDLQEGDEIRALFGRATRDGQFVGYDERPRALIFRQGDRTLSAIPFPNADGSVGWFDLDGRSLKRQFLKSPLRLQTSISSGFSYRRLHPVTGQFRAHPAIDYRAPYGEPVIAVAAGTVTFAAMSGASGRLVTIRHAGGYETLYLHLSAFGPGIRAGARVDQGQVIGRVGNSGVVTGTHLDYRLKKDGAYVNPLVEHSKMPPGDPIPDERREEFLAERDRLLAELDQLLPPSPVPASASPLALASPSLLSNTR